MNGSDFVFPVHGWRVPRLVREFISKMKILTEPSDATDGNKAKADDCLKNRPFAYCVCTAGDSIGLTIENLNKVHFPESFASGSGHYGGFILLLSHYAGIVHRSAVHGCGSEGA